MLEHSFNSLVGALLVISFLSLIGAFFLKERKSLSESRTLETDMSQPKKKEEDPEIKLLLGNEEEPPTPPESRQAIDFGFSQGLKFGFGFGLGLSLWGIIMFIVFANFLIRSLGTLPRGM